jgi:hypothetical protein
MKSRLNHPKSWRLNSYSVCALVCVGMVIGCFLAGLLGKHLA